MNDEAKTGCLTAICFAMLFPFCLAGCYGCSNVEVSTGVRDATFRKVSKTGVVWKTYEAEFYGDGLRMAEGKLAPETFQYTIRDPVIVRALEKLPATARVRVHYTKHLTAWQPDGETRYLMTGFEMLP